MRLFACQCVCINFVLTVFLNTISAVAVYNSTVSGGLKIVFGRTLFTNVVIYRVYQGYFFFKTLMLNKDRPDHVKKANPPLF